MYTIYIMSIEGPKFLKDKFNTHKSGEVLKAADRTEMRTGEKVPQKPEAQIQNYLDRFKEIVAREDSEEKERGLKALKKILHKEYVISSENIPESYFELQQQIAREQGHGDIEITGGMRGEAVKVIQEDQKVSLNQWIDYLSGPDSFVYPDWAKYWAFKSMLGMSSYDKEEHKFGNRSKETTAPFPDLNQEALSQVVEWIEKQHSDEYVKNKSDIQVLKKRLKKLVRLQSHSPSDETANKIASLEQDLDTAEQEGDELSIQNPVEAPINPHAQEKKAVSDEQFTQLLENKDFSQYYAFAIEYVTVDSSELYKITEGEWRTFEKGTPGLELASILQGHGTGWCTAGESTADSQLASGDFHVYLSRNNLGENKIPRLAIRMQGNSIAEVRGVAPQQNIDPYISPVLGEKMSEFGSQGEIFKKKSEDMTTLTKIDQKNTSEEELSQEELRFLYEIDSDIVGFGYGKDPRISEIRKERNKKEDIVKAILGNIDSVSIDSLVAESPSEITADTRIILDDFTITPTALIPKDLEYIEGNIVFDEDSLEEDSLSLSVGEKLISLGKDIKVSSSLKFFKIDAIPKLAARLINEGNDTEIFTKLRRYDLLKRFNYLKFAKLLLSSGKESLLLDNLSSFSKLDSDFALELFDLGHGQRVINTLRSFSELDSRVALEIISEGARSMIFHGSVEIFKFPFNTEVVETLISRGDVNIFLYNKEKFVDVSEEDVFAMIARYEQWGEVSFAKINPIYHDRIFEKLLSKNLLDQAIEAIDDGADVSKSNLDSLINMIRSDEDLHSELKEQIKAGIDDEDINDGYFSPQLKQLVTELSK